MDTFGYIPQLVDGESVNIRRVVDLIRRAVIRLLVFVGWQSYFCHFRRRMRVVVLNLNKPINGSLISKRQTFTWKMMWAPVRYEGIFVVIDGIVLLLFAPIIIISVATNWNGRRFGINWITNWNEFKRNRLLWGVDRIGDFIAVVVVIDVSFTAYLGRWLVEDLVIGEADVSQNAALRRIHNMQQMLVLCLSRWLDQKSFVVEADHTRKTFHIHVECNRIVNSFGTSSNHLDKCPVSPKSCFHLRPTRNTSKNRCLGRRWWWYALRSPTPTRRLYLRSPDAGDALRSGSPLCCLIRPEWCGSDLAPPPEHSRLLFPR